MLKSEVSTIPFTHFNLPPENHLSFNHELAHLLQFKLNEKERWNTGKFIFHVSYPGYRNLKRETATEAIEYNLVHFFKPNHKKEFYYSYDDLNKHRLALNFKKKYTKRLLKIRVKYILKWLNDNKTFVLKKKENCKELLDFLIDHKQNSTVSKIIKSSLLLINNSEWVEFKYQETESLERLLLDLYTIQSMSILEMKILEDRVLVLI